MDTEILEKTDTITTTDKNKTHHLVVKNDDFNTFDWIIESLIEVCNHSREQAEQCAYLVHYKGKAYVKSGTEKLLTPMKEELQNRGIDAIIETN